MDTDNFIENYPEWCFGDLYFPEDILDAVDNIWYSSVLSSLHEPSLFKSISRDRITYRFLYIRSFDEPILLRMEIDSKNCRNGVVLCKQPSTSQSKIYISTNPITETLKKIRDCDFWLIPETVPTLALDGAHWIFEGVHGGKYHFVDRWSPEDGAVRELGLHFLKLAELDNIEMY